MRALTSIIVLLLIQSFCMAFNRDLQRTRELYYKASSNKNDAERFSDFLSSSPDVEKTLLSGYQGLCYMIKASYSWNPYGKLSFFNKGKKMLDEAIQNDPDNMELRFLRFCVQANAPGFLGYNDGIAEDKQVILRKYPSSKDDDLKTRIRNYLITNKYCTASDRAILK